MAPEPRHRGASRPAERPGPAISGSPGAVSSRAAVSKLPAILTLVCNAGLATAQVGFDHDPSWLPDPIGPTVAMRMADMNGDGFADLVRLRGNGVELLLQNPQTGRFLRGAVQADKMQRTYPSLMARVDRKSTRLNSSHSLLSRMPSSA